MQFWRCVASFIYNHGILLGLGRNLSARCSTALQKEIDKNREEMTKDIAPLLLPPSAVLSQETILDDDVESTSVDIQRHVLPGIPIIQHCVLIFFKTTSVMGNNAYSA